MAGKTQKDKIYNDKNLVQRDCCVFDDGACADHYKLGMNYYYLSGTECLLLMIDPFPDVWNYDSVAKAITKEARNQFKEAVQSVELYDLGSLLENAYADYKNCLSDHGSDYSFIPHTVTIGAEAYVEAGKIKCCFEVALPPEGHYTNKRIRHEKTYYFSCRDGSRIQAWGR